MLFGCEAFEKLFTDNQKYFLELKRYTKLCSTKLEEIMEIIHRQLKARNAKGTFPA